MALNLLKLSIILLFLLFVVNPFPFVEPRALEASANPFAKTLQNLKGLHKGQKAKGVGLLRSYFQQFGYLAKENSPNLDDDNFDDNVESALKHYQSFHRLSTTGVVDDETIKTMSLPRCGMPDIIITNPNPNPNKGLVGTPEDYTYFNGSPKWSKFALTYAHSSSASLPISLSELKSAVQSAKQKWAAVTNFTFTEIENPLEADLVYGFHSGDHGDGNPFDGPGKLVGHGFAPENGRHHYDADNQWSTTGGGGANDMETWALHEVGHVLGLDHSDAPNAIMNPVIGGERRALSQDDIDGIRALYGF